MGKHRKEKRKRKRERSSSSDSVSSCQSRRGKRLHRDHKEDRQQQEENSAPLRDPPMRGDTTFYNPRADPVYSRNEIREAASWQFLHNKSKTMRGVAPSPAPALSEQQARRLDELKRHLEWMEDLMPSGQIILPDMSVSTSRAFFPSRMLDEARSIFPGASSSLAGPGNRPSPSRAEPRQLARGTLGNSQNIRRRSPSVSSPLPPSRRASTPSSPQECKMPARRERQPVEARKACPEVGAKGVTLRDRPPPSSSSPRRRHRQSSRSREASGHESAGIAHVESPSPSSVLTDELEGSPGAGPASKKDDKRTRSTSRSSSSRVRRDSKGRSISAPPGDNARVKQEPQVQASPPSGKRQNAKPDSGDFIFLGRKWGYFKGPIITPSTSTDRLMGYIVDGADKFAIRGTVLVAFVRQQQSKLHGGEWISGNVSIQGGRSFTSDLEWWT